MRDLSFDKIKQYFNLPILEAAIKLNISETFLKKLCRNYNIHRWPYRKIRFLFNKLNHANNQYERTTSKYWKRKIKNYQDQINSFYDEKSFTEFKKSDSNESNNLINQKLYYSVISPDNKSNTIEVG
jgi:hypothetical protein